MVSKSEIIRVSKATTAVVIDKSNKKIDDQPS